MAVKRSGAAWETIRLAAGKGENMKALVQTNYGSFSKALTLVELTKPSPAPDQILVDRIYPLSEAPAALQYYSAGHTRGKVAIKI